MHKLIYTSDSTFKSRVTPKQDEFYNAILLEYRDNEIELEEAKNFLKKRFGKRYSSNVLQSLINKQMILIDDRLELVPCDIPDVDKCHKIIYYISYLHYIM